MDVHRNPEYNPLEALGGFPRLHGLSPSVYRFPLETFPFASQPGHFTPFIARATLETTPPTVHRSGGPKPRSELLTKAPSRGQTPYFPHQAPFDPWTAWIKAQHGVQTRGSRTAAKAPNNGSQKNRFSASWAARSLASRGARGGESAPGRAMRGWPPQHQHGSLEERCHSFNILG